MRSGAASHAAKLAGLPLAAASIAALEAQLKPAASI
jgi:hypothetical protein